MIAIHVATAMSQACSLSITDLPDLNALLASAFCEGGYDPSFPLPNRSALSIAFD